jgi:hypothetical protein
MAELVGPDGNLYEQAKAYSTRVEPSPRIAIPEDRTLKFGADVRRSQLNDQLQNYNRGYWQPRYRLHPCHDSQRGRTYGDDESRRAL